MKKTKYLALVLVVAIMMMGAGYAYWTEVLTINTTVDTGILDVVFEEPANLDGEDRDQPNADVTANIHELIVTFTDVYPGVENEMYFNLVNKGTLEAYVDDFEIVTNPAYGIDNPNYITNVITCKNLRIDNVPVSMGGTSIQSLLDTLNGYNFDKGLQVYKDGTVKVAFTVGFSADADETTLPEDGVFAFAITSKVHQFNATR